MNVNVNVCIGLKTLRRLVRDPLELTSSSKKIIRAMKFIRAVELAEPLRSGDVNIYSLYRTINNIFSLLRLYNITQKIDLNILYNN